MSISTMTRFCELRQTQDQNAADVLLEGTRRRSASESSPTRPPQSTEAAKATALERLAGFVPTEVITAWAAAMGLLVPTAHWQRWVIFGGALVVMIALIFLNSAQLKRTQGVAKPVTAPVVKTRIHRLIIISTVAFTIWAFAAPGSPATVWGDGATRLFAVIALFVTPVLYKAAQLWGVAPLEPR